MLKEKYARDLIFNFLYSNVNTPVIKCRSFKK